MPPPPPLATASLHATFPPSACPLCAAGLPHSHPLDRRDQAARGTGKTAGGATHHVRHIRTCVHLRRHGSLRISTSTSACILLDGKTSPSCVRQALGVRCECYGGRFYVHHMKSLPVLREARPIELVVRIATLCPRRGSVVWRIIALRRAWPAHQLDCCSLLSLASLKVDCTWDINPCCYWGHNVGLHAPRRFMQRMR